MSRAAQRSKRVHPLGAVAHGIFVVACLSSCNGTSARIRTVSPQQLTEGRAATLALETEGCAPRFDIDRALRTGDDASARLGDGAPIVATRTGVESFSLRLEAMRPGSYVLDLELDDGRIAWLDGPLVVWPIDPDVVALDSPRAALFFGDLAVPFTVTLHNESVCAVDGLRVTPTFRQTGVALSLNVRGPSTVSLAPQSTAVFAYEVDLDSTLAAGPLEMNVTATNGTRSGGSGCLDTVDATNELHDFVWVVVPPDRQQIAVTGLDYNPQMPHRGGNISFQVTARNDSPSDITLERIDVRSDPSGLDTSTTTFTSPNLAPGAPATNRVSTRVPAVSVPTMFRVTVTVAGRDGDGTLYASTPGAGAVDVFVSP